MYEEFNFIPKAEIDTYTLRRVINDIYLDLMNVINGDQVYYNTSAVGMSPDKDYWLRTLVHINAINSDITIRETFRYYYNNYNRFKRATAAGDADYGIVINEEAGTHFAEHDFPTAKFMENAQNHLKHTPSQFLRIFTCETSNKLFVYTNKPLPIETIYKLFALSNSAFDRGNIIGTKFINACIEDNAGEANKILTDFFSSDEIINLEFNKFKSCLTHNSNSKIRNLENIINGYRRDITSYENEIANLATKIREENEKILFIKSRKGEDDDKLLFKYLKKHPYIKAFRGSSDGWIYMTYRAPLTYFSEDPAEKFIDNDYISAETKQIIEIIIGKKYELMTQCSLKFDTSSFMVTMTDNSESEEVLAHPHLSMFRCFGNHRNALNDSAEAGDYIGGIEQISQAVLNINFYDGAVINRMCEVLTNMWSTLRTWRDKETGEMLTTEEVVARGDYHEEA